MVDFYLRFNSKQQAHSVLYKEDGMPIFEVIDEIGTLYEEVGREEFIALDGYRTR